MNPEFVYFDLDNTLMDHTAAEAAAQKAIYKIFPELRTVSESEWVETYRQVNNELWTQYQNGETDRHQLQRSRFTGTMEKLGIPTGNSEEIGEEYMRRYRNHWRWVDGAKDVFFRICEKYPVGLITNGFAETQQLKIEFMELESRCRHIVISEHVGVMKPHRKVFDYATEKAGVARRHILYVGDSYSSDVVGGKKAGWKTAWFTAFTNHIEEGQTADFLFDRFSELEHLLN